MDIVENMRAFVAVARTGSFTAAAHALDLATSVVTKRVSQLERSVGAVLLRRTTRRVTLSADGEYHLGRIAAMVSVHDETLAAIRKGQQRLEGTVRIKVPTRSDPCVSIELSAGSSTDIRALMSKSFCSRPAQSGQGRNRHCDNRISRKLQWSGGRDPVVVAPKRRRVSKIPRSTFGSETPRDLARHECVAYQPEGPTWSFLGKTGITTVTVRPRLSSNDMLFLLEAIKDGVGIGLLSNYVTNQDIESKAVVQLLPEFPVPDLWVKAMVPVDRVQLPRVAALLAFLRSEGGDERPRPRQRRA